ncbi:MAG TPA: ABC transporter ATP-binding protein [Acidobacteriota bacterium]|nr:ABC transporter ATP-binding protein [Acidobacteriota bacterium]
MISIECREISKIFRSPRGDTEALRSVSFTAADHEFVCIVGSSGSGKTTLLKILARVLEPTAGEVVLRSANGSAPRNALVFQEHGLFPWMTVLENVAFGLEMQGVARRDRTDAAHCFIRKVGLDGYSKKYPYELSVGMRQRVALARAFVSNAQILLMDEPFASLDAQTKLLLQEEMLSLWSQERKLVIFVTHDMDEAILLADRILVMSGSPGTILEQIPVELSRPRNPTSEWAAAAELKGRIWTLLEQDVRRRLYGCES